MRIVIKLLLTAVILLGCMRISVLAQTNLLSDHNWNFQTSNESWLDDPAIYTDYEYATGWHCLMMGGVDSYGSGRFSIGKYPHDLHSSFYNCHGVTGDENDKLLAVNAFGGDGMTSAGTPSSKKIIQYTLQVQPNMLYDFTFYATHLSNPIHNYGVYSINAGVRFKVKCNSQTVYCNGGESNWQPDIEENNFKWVQSPVFRCLSNSSGVLRIALYDDCGFSAGHGDDFGIDEVRLVQASGYSITPEIFTAYGCSDSFDPIDVLSHVAFTQPEGQPELPAVIQIRKEGSPDWVNAMTTIQTNHGTAYLGSDNKVYYTPDPGYLGWDRVQYRVSKYGIVTNARNINIKVMSDPSDFVISGFPQDYWCKGSTFQPSATCEDHGGDILEEYWQWTTSLQQPQWNLMTSNFPESANCQNYYVRYCAENACGPAYSEPMLLRVCDEPVLNTETISPPNTICEGGSLPSSYLTQVYVSNWKNDSIFSGWQVKHGNGNWVPLGEAVLTQGDKLRYYAENHCGSKQTNEVSISVTAGPEFTQPTPDFDTYYCVNDQLNLSAQSIPNYQPNGISIDDHYWARSTDGGNTYNKINGNPTLDLSWDGNLVCYRLICACGSVDSYNPDTIHVYGDPVFSESLEPFEDPFCADYVLTNNDLQAPECSGSPGMTVVWQISSGTSQSGFSTLSLPKQLSREDDNGKWIRRYAVSECGNQNSNAIQIQVYDKPSLSNTQINAPAPICSGGSLPASFINQVTVSDWNGDPTDESGWWVKHPGGDWIPYTSETELQNGDQVQYQATNMCGTTHSNTVTLTVTDGPTVDPTPEFNSYFCVGDTLAFPDVPDCVDNGLNVLYGNSFWAYADSLDAPWIPFTEAPILTDTEEWNGRLIRFHLAYQCDGDTVYAFSPNPFPLTVYGPPSLVAPEEIPYSLDTVCWGTGLADILPEGFAPAEGCHYDSIGGYGWEISEGIDQSSQYYPVPDNYPLPATDDGHWIRFFVKGCGEPATSQPMRLYIGDAPTLYPEAFDLPEQVCAGLSYGSLIQDGLLTSVSVDDWHHFYDPNDPVDPSYERWEVFYNGSWQPLTTFELYHNGCPIRYVAHNQCGTTELVSETSIHVVEGPSFTSPNTPLQFEEQYCEMDPLSFPPNPQYSDPYNNVTDYYWGVSIDGVYYSEIEDGYPLPESWNGRYVSFILVSDCGGVITYSTPFQLNVIGAPEVDSITVEPRTLCEGELLSQYEEWVSWHNGHDNGSSSWQYAPASDPGNLRDFNPQVDGLPPGINKVTYHARNECDEAYCDYVEVEVLELPSFTDTEPFDLRDFCVDEPLEYPAAPQTEGYVEGAGVWQVSTTTNQYGPYVDVPNEPLTMADNGKWIKYSVFGCDGQPVSKYGEIHMIDVPQADFDFDNNLCRGQMLNPQPVSYSGDIDYVMWRYSDSNGNAYEFDPNFYHFDNLGVFYVSWVAVNQCNEEHPVFSYPRPVEVVQGPEFAAVSWPNSLEVCSGASLSDLLAEYNIDTPQLTDPSYEPAPQLLGWFVRHQDENNVMQYEPVSLGQSITEQYQGYELCYAMKGDCSQDPIYSGSVYLQVKGRPVINAVSLTDHFCAGEHFPPSDFQPDIDNHNNTYTSRWQWFDGNNWMDVPSQGFTVENDHDGRQLRYTISSTECDFQADVSDPVTLHVTGTPEILGDIQENIGVCADGSLVIDAPEVAWHNTVPETGEWQVCVTENGNYGVGPFGTDGIMFDMDHVAPYFDGWYLRYHVEGCGAQNNSNSSKIAVYESSEVQITGVAQAAVMNSFWPGVYYYYTEVPENTLNWTLTPDIWELEEISIDCKSCCKVIVDEKGQATLTASVGDGSCGTDSFVINASPFGVDETEALDVALYPNPAKHTVNVVSEDIVSVTVYDMLGQRLKTIEGHHDDQVSFSVEDFTEALYLVEVHTTRGNKTILLSVM